MDVQDKVDQVKYSSILTFLPPDTLREVLDQEPPSRSDVVVGFPMRVDYQLMEEMIKIDNCKLFLAQQDSVQQEDRGSEVCC